MVGDVYATEEVAIQVADYSDTVRVVSSARAMAGRAGFNDSAQYLIATAASELATNIIKYAKQGQVTLRLLRNDHSLGIEMVAQDQGPGIADIAQALQDNFSTGHSLGLGLSSVRRIMDEFAIQSAPGQGTTIRARRWK